MTNAQRIVEALLTEVRQLREGQEERVSKWRNLCYDKAREVERLRQENEELRQELRQEIERLRKWAEDEEGLLHVHPAVVQ